MWYVHMLGFALNHNLIGSTEKETWNEAETPETKVSAGLGYCKSEYLVRE